jgi:two-component system nitrogen regulation sensor histidine kinase NtrY
MRSRTPFRNNAPAVLAATAAALALLLGVQAVVRKSRDFAPDFMASVLLYGLTVLNISLLLVLVVVLARNLVRVVMERRRRVVGARFRMRLILVFLLMAIAPSGMLIAVGSDLIQEAVDRWFSVDVDRILSSSHLLATSLRDSAAAKSRVHARWMAREIGSRGLLTPEGQSRLRRTVEVRARELEMDAVDVFAPDGELVAVLDPRLPSGRGLGATAEELAQAALAGREAEAATPFAGGELMRAAVPIRVACEAPTDPGCVEGERVVGAVVVSSLLPAAVAGEAVEVQERYTTFRKAETAKGPIKAMYLSLYFFPALLILFGAVWLALYLARRITTPLRLVADGAERIASGERGVRVDFAVGDDEFAALISSFNRMSERLARTEDEVALHRSGLTRKNEELEERRRFIETVLETVGTGVLVVDAGNRVRSMNAAAGRLLELPAEAVGRPAAEVLQGPGRDAVLALLERQLEGRGSRQDRDVLVPEGNGQRHLAATVVTLRDLQGAAEGAVAVLDDLTPLIRAQKVAAWGEVARKLAHEIKNPLTPIQLSAQRVRKAHLKGSPDFPRVLAECTQAIVQEVEALKNLVDEFAQFARLPAAHLVPGSLHDVVEQTLSLYDGFSEVRVERRLDPELPVVRFDAAQMKRVLINLVDNAIEATDRRGTVTVFTEYDREQGRVRLGVADDGPGIPPQDRDKLFVPNFSTKKQGSGLGLAIVSRILQEHHGTIRVEDNRPRGARFVAEIPA